MNMQLDIGELLEEGRKEGDNERRRLGLTSRFGHQGASPKAKLSQKTEGSSTSSTGLRTRTETMDNMEDKEVIFEMEKGPKQQIKVKESVGNARQPPLPQPYRSRWMRRPQTAQMGTQTMAANLIIKMEGLNLAQQRETEIQQEILCGSLWQEQLKKQLEECSRKRRQELATATNQMRMVARVAEVLQLRDEHQAPTTITQTTGRQSFCMMLTRTPS
jgi:hypothetical protein